MAEKTPKLRIFAGPNGSGKSTIIDAIRKFKVKNNFIDFGVYVNADLIQQSFLSNQDFILSLSDYGLSGTTEEEFHEIVMNGGLVKAFLSEEQFSDLYSINNDTIRFNSRACETYGARLAQVLADFLRQQGYKIYLYFIATEDPDINKYRVESRVYAGGHDVPADRIESRYKKSLDLMFEAAQIAHKAYFFDNSKEGQEFKTVAYFEAVKDKKKWSSIDFDSVPQWFKKYYIDKDPDKELGQP